jgi:hypothetical protein
MLHTVQDSHALQVLLSRWLQYWTPASPPCTTVSPLVVSCLSIAACAHSGLVIMSKGFRKLLQGLLLRAPCWGRQRYLVALCARCKWYLFFVPKNAMPKVPPERMFGPGSECRKCHDMIYEEGPRTGIIEHALRSHNPAVIDGDAHLLRDDYHQPASEPWASMG